MENAIGQVIVAINGSEDLIGAGVSFYQVGSNGRLDLKEHTKCQKRDGSNLEGLVLY